MVQAQKRLLSRLPRPQVTGSASPIRSRDVTSCRIGRISLRIHCAFVRLLFFLCVARTENSALEEAPSAVVFYYLLFLCLFVCLTQSTISVDFPAAPRRASATTANIRSKKEKRKQGTNYVPGSTSRHTKDIPSKSLI